MAGLGLLNAFGAGVSGMFSSQLATQIINHNIANANTPGYTRQSVQIGSARPGYTTYGAIGRGATIQGIARNHNAFLARQVVEETAKFSHLDVLDETLSTIEQIFGSVDNDRIGDAMNEFFGAWSDLATPPVSQEKRVSVVSQAQRLALEFREIDNALASLQRDSAAAVDEQVAEVNILLNQISELNEQIVANTAGEQLPNDLLDQRGRLLDDLSQLTRFTVNERADGSMDVLVEGRALVTRGHVNELRVVESERGDGTVTKKAQFGGSNPVTVEFREGAIVGRLELANDVIPELRSQLDQLARDLMGAVNALHAEGVTEGGSGVAIFEGVDAASMVVNAAILENAGLIASGRTSADGDNTLALEIAALGDATRDGRGFSLNEQYSELVVQLASRQGTTRALLESQSAITEAAVVRLDSERGVNLDEELANLMLYQRSYEANARVIRAVDEMLDTLINGMI